MKKKNDFIVGVVLIAASIAVAVRYFYLMDALEQNSQSVFFLRLAFVIFVVILAGAGVKKIVTSKQEKESLNSSENNDEDI